MGQGIQADSSGEERSVWPLLVLRGSWDGRNQRSSYQSRQESGPLFIVEFDGQLKAFWNSSKLLTAPLTLEKICHSSCHLILPSQEVLEKNFNSVLLTGMLHSFHLFTRETTEDQKGEVNFQRNSQS